MFETTLTIQRPNPSAPGTFTTIATGVAVQVDQASPKEVLTHMQTYNYTGQDLFKIYTLGWYPSALVHRGDLLLDEKMIDYETGSNFVYNVLGRPKNYVYDHQEIYVGTDVGD